MSNIYLSNRSSIHLLAILSGKRGYPAALQDRLLKYLCGTSMMYMTYMVIFAGLFIVLSRTEDLIYTADFHFKCTENYWFLVDFLANKFVYNLVSHTKYMPIFVKCI